MEQEDLVNNNIRDGTMWIFLFEYLEGKLTEQEKSYERRINEHTAEKNIIKFLLISIHVDNI